MRNSQNSNGHVTIETRSISSTSSRIIRLNEHIGLVGCISIIVGMIIGSGIFVSPVGITHYVGSVGLSLSMWIAVGIFCMLCALCYAELGSCMPESGGEYIYVKHAWGDLMAFQCMWINLILINPVCVAASSLVFAIYILKPVFPHCDPPQVAVQLIAFLAVALITAVNMYSVTMVTKLQYFITACKVTALVGVIAIGFVQMGQGNVEHFQNAFEDSDYSIGAVCMAFYSGFWAYGGWNYLNYVTGEVINPKRNLPLGIMISIVLVIVVYVLANCAYFSVLSPIEMLQSSAVAVTFLDRTVPPLSYIVPALIAVSVLGGMNGAILSVSRLFFVAAKHHHLPGIIAMINLKTFTPIPSLLTMFVLITVLQFVGDIFYLIEMMGFSLTVILVTVFAGQVKLRWTYPNLPRPIKLPVVVPLFLCLVCASLLCVTMYQKSIESCVAVAVMVCGVPAYILGCKWKKPTRLQRLIDSVTKSLQILLLVAKVEEKKSEIVQDPVTEMSTVSSSSSFLLSTS